MNVDKLYSVLRVIAMHANLPITAAVQKDERELLATALQEAMQPVRRSKDLTEVEAHRSIIRDLVMLLDDAQACECPNCEVRRMYLFGGPNTFKENFKFQSLLT